MACVFALLLIAAAALLAFSNFEFSLLSARLLAAAHPRVEMRGVLWKTTMVISYAFFRDNPRTQSLLLGGGAFMLAYDYMRYVRGLAQGCFLFVVVLVVRAALCLPHAQRCLLPDVVCAPQPHASQLVGAPQPARAIPAPLVHSKRS